MLEHTLMPAVLKSSTCCLAKSTHNHKQHLILLQVGKCVLKHTRCHSILQPYSLLVCVNFVAAHHVVVVLHCACNWHTQKERLCQLCCCTSHCCCATSCLQLAYTKGALPPLSGGALHVGRHTLVVGMIWPSATGLFLFAAGNNGQLTDSTDITQQFFPADYGLANQISVGASDTSDALAAFSNYGA